jgi:hypothetical protein
MYYMFAFARGEAVDEGFFWFKTTLTESETEGKRLELLEVIKDEVPLFEDEEGFGVEGPTGFDLGET